MLLYRLPVRAAALLRLIGLGLVCWSLFAARHHPGGGGRDLLVAVLLGVAVVAWLAWTLSPYGGRRQALLDLYVLAVAGGVLSGAAPDSAASVFVFVAVVAAGVRVPLARAAIVVALGTLALSVSDVIYRGSALGLLAYALGFTAALLAASNSRQSIDRAEQAELLLAQVQRSHEEQLRTARLEESTRIAREIHDVLAHTLAGLSIQIEATASQVEQGAQRAEILARLRRAHELARDGLRETRLAVGALRGGPAPSARDAVEALVADYRAGANAQATLILDGDPLRLSGEAGHTIVRVVQEALTNARKHAPGADVSIEIHAGERPEDDLVLVIDDRPGVGAPAPANAALAAAGGGFGVRGMRERAQLLGGTLSAGAEGKGWRVELRLPPQSPTPTGAEARA